jgi:Protein kinase domain
MYARGMSQADLQRVLDRAVARRLLSEGEANAARQEGARRARANPGGLDLEAFLEEAGLPPALVAEFLDQGDVDATLIEPIEDLEIVEVPTIADSTELPLVSASAVKRSLQATDRRGPIDFLTGATGNRFGPYVVQDTIARGAMGIVFRACHHETGAEVALKVLVLAPTKNNTKREKRFQREIHTAQRLSHPGIVRVIEAGDDAGQPWMAMELVEGRTLQQALEDLCIEELVRILADVAAAIDHAHAQGIIHRDLKPSNIIIRDSDQSPVVTDFGLVRDLQHASSLSASGQSLGTPYYMSPEQAKGETPTPATDVYALCVILYQGLTGRYPFEAASFPLLIDEILAGDVVPPSKRAPKVSADLEQICLKGLSCDPRDRHRSGAGLAQDLRRWLEQPRVVPADDPAPEPAKAGPPVTLLVAAAVFVLILLGGVAWSLHQRKQGLESEPEASESNAGE